MIGKIILTENTAANLLPTLQKFICSEKSSETWLRDGLAAELPEKSADEIQQMEMSIKNSVSKWNENIKSINDACDVEGQSKEKWFSDKIKEISPEIEENDLNQLTSAVSGELDKINDNSIGMLKVGKIEPKERKEEWTQIKILTEEVNLSSLVGIALGDNDKLKSITSKIEQFDEIADALRTGNDTKLKESAAAALNVSVVKGKIPFLPKNTPTEIVSGIACFGVEQAEIMLKYAEGEISGTKAVEMVARSAIVNAANVFTVIGEKFGQQLGRNLGIAVASVVPVLAPVAATVGSFIGASIGRMAGSHVAKAATKLVQTVKPIIKNTYEKLKEKAQSLWESAKNFVFG